MWGLRDYKVEGQLGLEDTPEEYVNRLVEIFREVKRVLKKDGTIWLNLGDSYYGSGRGHNCEHSKGKYTKGQYASASSALNKVDKTKKRPYLKPKDMCGIPFRTAFALQERLGLYLRQAIIWEKPNSMPSSVKDHPTTSYEFIFLFSKSEKYYYEQQFEPMLNASRQRYKRKYTGSFNQENKTSMGIKRKDSSRKLPIEGRNQRNVWSFNTTSYLPAHFAVFPEELPRRCLKAGCPENGICLDPFMGAGTTALVALKQNKRFVGIELNESYIRMAQERIKPWMGQKRLGDF